MRKVVLTTLMMAVVIFGIVLTAGCVTPEPTTPSDVTPTASSGSNSGSAPEIMGGRMFDLYSTKWIGVGQTTLEFTGLDKFTGNTSTMTYSGNYETSDGTKITITNVKKDSQIGDYSSVEDDVYLDELGRMKEFIVMDNTMQLTNLDENLAMTFVRADMINPAFL